MSRAHIENLDLTQLLLVEAIADTGSVSKAAERVGITQPAASHALARARSELGDPIFVRTPNGMRPTPYGEHLAASIGQGLTLVRDGLTLGRAFDPLQSTRSFAVSLSAVGQIVVLPSLIGYMQANAPHATLRVHPVPIEGPSATLESGEVDVAIGYIANVSAGCFQRVLFDERYVCVVRESHPAFAQGMSLQAFAQVPQAFADKTGMAHEHMNDLLRQQGVKRDTRLYVPQFTSLPFVIMKTNLLVIMPERLARQFATLVPIKVMEPPVYLPSYEVRLYWHQRYNFEPAHRWFRQTIIDLASQSFSR